MRRKDVAKFFTAERSVSPLAACGLLLVAGIIAGSLNLVAPSVNESALTAATAPATAPAPAPAANQPSAFNSQSPKTCEEAILAALNKTVGPAVRNRPTSGQQGTLDKCYGGILLQGKTPSSNPRDYECVGRKGDVHVSYNGVTSNTFPDRSVASGTCEVKVCNDIQTGDFVCGNPQRYAGLNAGAGNAITSTPPASAAPTPAGETNPNPAAPVPSTQTQTPTPAPTCNPANGPCPASTPTTPPDSTPGLAQPRTIEVPVTDQFGNPTGVTQTVQVPAEPTPSTAATVPTGDLSTMAGFMPPTGTPDPSGLSTDFVTSGAPQPTTPPTPASTFTSDGVPPNLGGTMQTEGFLPPQTPPATSGALEPQVQAQTGQWVPNSLDSYNTPIDCSGSGCIASPTTEAEYQQFVRNGYSCTPSETGGGFCTSASPVAPTATPPTAPPATPLDTSCGNPPCQTPQQPPQNPPQTPQQPPQNPQQPPQNPQTPPVGSYAPSGSTPSPTPGTGSNNGAMNGLMSFLSGFMRGFTGAAAQGQAQTCPTDPNAYAQYQQQYNYQLQQYNYQLQQYNYQMQMQQYNGYTGYSAYPPQQPTPPQPCQPGSNNGQNGSGGSGGTGGTGTGVGGTNQCPQYAAPTAESCSIGKWQQKPTTLANGLVCPVWQCVAENRPQPTALLTCDPNVAEDGTTVQISYSCTNSASSTGFGFVTGGSVSGATTTTITNPPANAAGINYVLRCENGSVTAASQCTVQLARPSVIVRAQPNSVLMGATTTIGWTSSAMKSCTVSSPDQQDFTVRNVDGKSTSGAAVTSPINKNDTVFLVTCISVTGKTVFGTTTVSMRTPGSVSSTLDNRTNIRHGTQGTVQWTFPDAPATAAVALWLVDTESEQVVALIAGNRARTGTYLWNIPTPDEPCNTQSSLVCGSDLVPGRSYLIQASVYTPANAGLGQFADPSLPEPVYLEKRLTRTFRMQ